MKILVALSAIVLVPACVYAVDGQILINQASVTAARGFPYKITQPGSYKLAGNLIVPSGAIDGIDITSDFVTLDLNGFSITGGGGGIGISADNSRITVENGSVSNFSTGINIGGSGELLTALHASGNGTGISVFGSGVVVRCTADRNTQFGFSLGGVAISESSASGNNFGIVTGLSLVTNNILVNNSTGIEGFAGEIFQFGNNTIVSNTFDIGSGGSGVSQKNNVCTTGIC